jgi:hypothetical protein
MPACRIVNRVVAVPVPIVKIIRVRSIRSLILRIVRALNGDHLAGIDFRAALRHGNFCLSSPNDRDGLGIGRDFNAVIATLQRMNSDIRCIYFRGSLGVVLEDAVIHRTLRDLHLDVRARDVHNLYAGVFVQADHIGVVELHFSARTIAGQHAVSSN